AVTSTENVARHCQNVAALPKRAIGCDERAALVGSLDDDDGERESADDAIAIRKMVLQRQRPRRKLADDRALLADLVREPRMLARIDHIDAAAEHRDGGPAALERAAMRR